jgi:hypothetical protein
VYCRVEKDPNGIYIRPSFKRKVKVEVVGLRFFVKSIRPTVPWAEGAQPIPSQDSFSVTDNRRLASLVLK